MPEKSSVFSKFNLASILLLVFIVAGAAVYAGLFAPKYSAFGMLKSGEKVAFVSNEVDPNAFFGKAGESVSFVVSPKLAEAGGVNTFMSNGLNAFIVVLSGNRKDTTQLLQVFTGTGALKECISNFGDFNSSKTVSPAECSAMLSDGRSVRIVIDFPDASRQNPAVVVSGNQILILPSNEREIPELSRLVLLAMFSNAQEIIDKTNAVGSRLGGAA
ncbi:MAG: hypothetical protein HY394_05805 [Candidatus Diapherotrites archaeon]|nr:hypothetical protein [Candidatus Diapherotrites archaeon]